MQVIGCLDLPARYLRIIGLKFKIRQVVLRQSCCPRSKIKSSRKTVIGLEAEECQNFPPLVLLFCSVLSLFFGFGGFGGVSIVWGFVFSFL